MKSHVLRVASAVNLFNAQEFIYRVSSRFTVSPEQSLIKIVQFFTDAIRRQPRERARDMLMQNSAIKFYGRVVTSIFSQNYVVSITAMLVVVLGA